MHLRLLLGGLVLYEILENLETFQKVNSDKWVNLSLKPFNRYCNKSVYVLYKDVFKKIVKSGDVQGGITNESVNK